MFAGSLLVKNSSPFTLVIKTDNLSAGSTANNQFRIPHYSTGTYSYDVDWGDGSVENVVGNTSPTHTYTNIGTYEVKIKGVFEGVDFANTGDRLKLLEVVRWGRNKWGNLNFAFFGCNNLIVTASDGYLFGKSAAIWALAFRNCNNINTLSIIDVSGATTLRQALFGASNIVNFPFRNTGNVTNMEDMCSGCGNLINIPLVETGNVTIFVSAFSGCTSLTTFPLWDTSKGVIFTGTWANCKIVNFPLLDFSSAINVSAAWVNNNAMTEFPALDLSNVQVFTQAWRGCTALVSFPLLNIQKATTFVDGGTGGAWGGCTSLQHFSAGFFDSWTATPAQNCFRNTWSGCTSLTAQSVENILVSIDTSGRNAPDGATGTQADITIAYNVATGTLTSATNTAITNLKAKGWKPHINNVYV